MKAPCAAEGILWLASYPKSGNTWFRIFLTNLLQDGTEPVDINDLERSLIASARDPFDESVGLEASDLGPEEIDRLRPEYYCRLAREATEPLYMKVHDAYTEAAPGMPIIPAAATKGALYLVRNPLDVAVSFAHHNGIGYDAAIRLMAQEDTALCFKPRRLHDQLRQKLLSWSGHVRSWTEAAPFHVCTIRYEDMKADPLETFNLAARFLGLPRNKAQIEKAVRFSSFEQMRKQEETNGFRERSPHAKHFFRKGKVGSWREELSDDQVQRILQDHREVMRRLGYLDERGEIVG